MKPNEFDFIEFRRDGHNYLLTIDGKVVPIISGGDGEGGGEGDKEPTMSELVKLVQNQAKLITTQQEQMRQHEAKFDELVESIADAMKEDEKEGDGEEEGDVEEEEIVREPEARRRSSESNKDSEELVVLRRQIQKMSKQMEEMQGKMKQKDEEAQEERELRLASQRDNLLQEALQQAGVLTNAMPAAMKFFADNVIYDEQNDRFLFEEEKSGAKLSIAEGVKDNLPDYFKQTTARQGGGGGRGSQANAVLEQARASLSTLHAAARKTGNDSDVSAYHNAKKKVIELEKQAGLSKQVGSPAPASAPVSRSQAGARKGTQPAEEFVEGESQ